MVSGYTLSLNLFCTVSFNFHLSTRRKNKSFSNLFRGEHSAFSRKLTLILRFLFLPLGIFVLKILSPHDICQGTKKYHCWQIFIEVGVKIPITKFFKVYPPDYPKDVACGKHPPKSITSKDAASCERNVLPMSLVMLICI